MKKLLSLCMAALFLCLSVLPAVAAEETLYRSSAGATTSTVYDTLSENYSLRRTREGCAKFISSDKQIDATTCLFPIISGLSRARTF